MEDFSFAGFDDLDEEAKKVLRQSAKSFEKAMEKQKMEMRKMFEEFKREQEELNHQLKDLSFEKTKTQRVKTCKKS